MKLSGENSSKSIIRNNYNFIVKFDVVSANTICKIQLTFDWTKNKNSSKVQVQLEINIINVDYAKDYSTIRIHGVQLRQSNM